MFNNTYKNKKVLITGHTGFKGSWLTTWLLNLGAEIIGISKDVPTIPAMFQVLELEEKIQHHLIDIRDIESLTQVFLDEKPDFVFHLAAQAIVSTSYGEPLDTISSNVMGTTNLLESLRISNHQCTAVIITSDKAYDNVEQVWGYKENDQMGGRDVYSGSKGAAELIIKAYYHSFFKSDESNVRLAIARAGNVIGGGDWAEDRIVVDAVAAWHQGEKVEIRSPEATRPWQHVLEPLSGYLNLGQRLHCDKEFNGEGFNFGPRAEQNRTVKELLQDLSKYWDFDNNADAFTITDNIPFHEAGLLKLNCDKALSKLKWQATLDYQATIKFTSQWYYQFYNHDKNVLEQTMHQIGNYEDLAKSQKLAWTV
jgi:CDP-glucose 4,6-dehydratase